MYCIFLFLAHICAISNLAHNCSKVEITLTTPQPRGDPFGHKTLNFRDIKLQIFVAEGAENFEKFRIFKENWLYFEF